MKYPFESLMKKIEDVYDSLQDELSRVIFTHKFQNLLLNDSTHLYDMIIKTNSLGPGENKSFNQYLKSQNISPDDEIVLYGTGNDSPYFVNLLKSSGHRNYIFCDSDSRKWDSSHLGVKVISPQLILSDHMDSKIIITSNMFYTEIRCLLLEMGCPEKRILEWGNHHKQYFGEPFITPCENEVFVDAGAYTGDTVGGFIRFCNGNYKHIYALEPDIEIYEKMRQNIEKNRWENVTPIAKGAWRRASALKFRIDHEKPGSSRVSNSEEDELRVEVDSIDHIAGNEIVTFIKMDIEGSEMDALIGAKETITRNKPKLAICVYHRPEDVLSIPTYIKRLVPEYKFYLRHHSGFPRTGETVLYAVV